MLGCFAAGFLSLWNTAEVFDGLIDLLYSSTRGQMFRHKNVQSVYQAHPRYAGGKRRGLKARVASRCAEENRTGFLEGRLQTIGYPNCQGTGLSGAFKGMNRGGRAARMRYADGDLSFCQLNGAHQHLVTIRTSFRAESKMSQPQCHVLRQTAGDAFTEKESSSRLHNSLCRFCQVIQRKRFQGVFQALNVGTKNLPNDLRITVIQIDRLMNSADRGNRFTRQGDFQLS